MFIPLAGRPFVHHHSSFPRLKKWQLPAAVVVVHGLIKKGNVLGPFPGNISTYPITGHPLLFYPSFVVPKSKSGSYRWILIASENRRAPSLNDRIFNYTTSFVGFKESLVP